MTPEFIRRIVIAALPPLFPILSCAAFADDTELYIAQPSQHRDVNPNVLFIIDTSASMDGKLVQTTPYDPRIAYSGGTTGACDNDNMVYFSAAGSDPPECGPDTQFSRGKLVCHHALEKLYGAPGSATGLYTDQFAAWKSDQGASNAQWVADRFHATDRTYIECEDDSGVHGEHGGGPAWPHNGDSGPWAAEPPKASIWGNKSAFTVYSAHYLRWYHFHGARSVSTRLGVIQDVVKAVVDSVSGINVGLMRFDTTMGDFGANRSTAGIGGKHNANANADSQGGLVVFPIRNVNQPGIRQAFKDQVDQLSAFGNTPLAETLYEAMLYYRGLPITYGRGENGAWSHPDSRTGARYISPITDSCAPNYIILLSDGKPSFDDDADDAIRQLLSGTTELSSQTCGNDQHGSTAKSSCLDKLAAYLYLTDSADARTGNDLPGKQNITTYTVGFNLEQGAELMRATARSGGGEYFHATNAQQLSNAFTQIIEGISRVKTSFTAPAVPVNAFNRLTHGNEIYFSVFQPDSRPHWSGNVKKYTLEIVRDESGNLGDANNDRSPELVIRDANGHNAVSDITGLFTEHSRSFWTPDDFAPDGELAGKGGMASRLFDYDSATGQHLAQSREQFVYTVTGRIGQDINTDLTHPDNRVHEGNALLEGLQPDGRITRELIGIPGLSDVEFTNLLKWARGVDIRDDDGDGSTEDGRPVLGAPLHTRPYLVTYRVDHSAGAQNDFLFIFTNDGYVHMTSADKGAVEKSNTHARLELWSFIPPELL